MNAETTINSQNKSQAKSTSAFVNSRKRTYKLHSVCRTLRELPMSYSQKTISTENLELWRDSQRIPSFFSLQLRTSNSETMSSDILFIFVSSASVIFFASGLFWGLEKHFYIWHSTYSYLVTVKSLGLRTVVLLWSPLDYFNFNLQLTTKTSTTELQYVYKSQFISKQ